MNLNYKLVSKPIKSDDTVNRLEMLENFQVNNQIREEFILLFPKEKGN